MRLHINFCIFQSDRNKLSTLKFSDHRQKLRDVKLRKLDQLRRAGVPEKYCSEVMRRAFDDGQKHLGM